MPLLLGILLSILSSAQTTTVLMEAAVRQESLGQYREAEKLLRGALGARNENDRRSTATILNNLGGVLLSQGRYLEAETALNRSLVYFQEEPGIDWTAPLNHLAMLYRETGRLRESEDCYRRVLAARSTVLPAGNIQVARSRANLAALLIQREALREARQQLEQALATFLTVPETRIDRLSAAMNLATIDASEGRLARARSRASEAIAMMDGPDAAHPMLGKALLNLGRIDLRLGENHAAENSLGKSVQILRMHLHPAHPVLAEAILDYAEALRKCGKSSEAKRLKREATVIAVANRSENPTAHKIDVKDLRIEALR